MCRSFKFRPLKRVSVWVEEGEREAPFFDQPKVNPRLLAVGKERGDVVGFRLGDRLEFAAFVEVESFEVIKLIGQGQDVALVIEGDAVLLLFVLTKGL